jgi:hypothetical protein
VLIIPVEAYPFVCEGYHTHVRLVQEAGSNGVREAAKKYMANLLHMVLSIDVSKAKDLIRKRIRPN